MVAPEKDGGSWVPFSYCAPNFRVKFTTVLSAGLCYTVTPAGFQVLPALLYSASFISKPTSKDIDSGGNSAAIITAPGHALPGGAHGAQALLITHFNFTLTLASKQKV